MIDHHLGTNELWAVYVPGSGEVMRVDQYIADYDHQRPLLGQDTVFALCYRRW